jgi:type I site-specific restriction endonuclease
MIGRGTRLCPNVFGIDQPKTEFLIFDVCQNFEFFALKPEGFDGGNSKPLTQQIFDHDLFADEDMIPLALSLAGLGEHKPLECVGTYDEVQVALYLARKKYQVSNPDSQPLPPVLATLNNQLLTSRPDQAWEELADHLLTSWNNNHYLDANLVKLLKSYLT